MRKREPRRKVMLRARMRSGAQWGDVLIHNMSSRGLLATTEEGFRPGTVIEIRRIHHIIVGRVVWQNGSYFGVRTQDVIDIDGILAAKPPTHKPGSAPNADGERRAERRVIAPAAQADRSRRIASQLQFVALLIAIGAAALVAAGHVSDILSRPMATIGASLDVDHTPAAGG